MCSLRTFPFTVLLAAAIAISVEPAAAGDPLDASAAADQLFRDAGRAYDAGDFERARALYGQAFQQKKTHDIAAMLAQSEMKLGKPCDAREHLGWAVAHFPPSLADERRARIERAYADVKRRVGALAVHTEPAGASVQVDFSPVDASALPGPICVPAGDRTVFVSLDGFAVERRIVTVEPGDVETVTVTLRRIEPAASPSAPPPGPRRLEASTVPTPSLQPLQVSGIVVGAGALGAIVAGAVLISLGVDVGQQAASLSRRIETRLGPGACPLPGSDALLGPPMCNDLASARAAEAGLLNGGVWSFIGAASLGAVSGGILLLRTPGGGARPGGPRVTVGAAGSGAFVAVEGAF